MSKLKEKPRVYPVPEILDDGRDWRVENSDRPATDYETKTLLVPLDDDPVARNVSLRQVASVKYDDRKIVLPDTMLHAAVEMHRLHYLMQRAGIDISGGFVPDEVVREANLYSYDKTRFLTTLLITDYTADAARLAPTRELAPLLARVRSDIAAQPTKANVLVVVKWLVKQLKESNQRLPGDPSDYDDDADYDQDRRWADFMPSGIPTASRRRQRQQRSVKSLVEEAMAALPDDRKMPELPAAVRDQLPEQIDPKFADEFAEAMNNPKISGFAEWGKMTIHEPPRPINVLRKMVRRWRVTEEGVFARYPHRYAIDGQVFARRVKIPGGTVLIDHSGSMHLEAEQVDALVNAAPGCTVASYSATYREGVLRVLAKGGRRVEPRMCGRPSELCNVVDYPALVWAYSQSAPRIWVCDGKVTGIGDHKGNANLPMCLALCRRGRISRYGNVDEAIKRLDYLRRFYGRQQQ